MAKIKVQVVKDKKKGIIRKVIWGVIALIGFLASLVTVIDFAANNKGYLSKLVNGVKNLLGMEESVQKESQPETPKKIPELKPEQEKTSNQEKPSEQKEPQSELKNQETPKAEK